ncbi:hypothetical protein V6N13_012987 [Hibiscus sabdariffa]
MKSKPEQGRREMEHGLEMEGKTKGKKTILERTQIVKGCLKGNNFAIKLPQKEKPNKVVGEILFDDPARNFGSLIGLFGYVRNKKKQELR